MSLRHKTILITRQREQSIDIIKSIEKRGGRAVLLPMINIQDPESWEACDRALLQIRSYIGLIFTSTNGVRKFFERCATKSVELPALRHCDVYAVGERTKAAIEENGLPVKAIPDDYTSDSLAEYFRRFDIRGKRFLYPRGDLGKRDLLKSLVHQGASVDTVVVYRNTGPVGVDAENVYRQLAAGQIDVITFASPSAAINFMRLFPLKNIETRDKKAAIAVIGPTTREAVKKLGVHVDIVAVRSTVEGLLDSIEKYYAV
jgi:uroporphyrinogen-III synthase